MPVFRRRLLAMALPMAALLDLPVPGSASPMPGSFAPLIRKVGPTIVGVSVIRYAAEPPPRPRLRLSPHSDIGSVHKAGPADPVRSAGSGFIISSSGIIVTNNHVVGNASRIIVTLDDGTKLPARVAGTDQLTDLAIVKVEPGGSLPYAQWGDSARIEVGDWVLAAGNPFDLGTSFTAGIISARGRRISDDSFDRFFQLDAPINPGNSGGPSFDLNGRVIGVNTAIVSPSGGSVGIGFAIPSDTARFVVGSLIAYGSVRRGWLGIGVEDRKGGAGGAVITRVEAEGPAARVGLKAGDAIVAVNRQPVGNAEQLLRSIARARPGQRDLMEIERSGRFYALSVDIGQRPDELRSY